MNLGIEEKKKHEEKVIDLKLKRYILYFLSLGYKTQVILKMLNIQYISFDEIRTVLIKDGEISEQEIYKAIHEKEEKDKNLIYKYAMLGYTYAEMTSKMPNAGLGTGQRLVNMLIEEGRLTKEEIDEARKQRYEREKGEYIYKCLKQGLGCDEIGKSKNVSRKSAITYRKKLIERGELTEDELKEAQANRRKRKQQQEKLLKNKVYDNKIILLSRLGFELQDIQKILQVSKSYLYERRKNFKEAGVFSSKEITSAINNKENEAKKRRIKIRKMAAYDEDLDKTLVQEHIEYAKAKFHLKELQYKDVKAARIAITMDADFVTLSNINFVITNLTRLKKYDMVLEFIEECMDIVDEPEKIRKTIGGEG